MFTRIELKLPAKAKASEMQRVKNKEKKKKKKKKRKRKRPETIRDKPSLRYFTIWGNPFFSLTLFLPRI